MRHPTAADALASMEPSSFRRYLKGRGWTEQPDEHGRWYRFRKEHEGKRVEVDIPSDPTFEDYGRRIAEAAEILSIVEDISPDELAANVANPNADILSFRFSGEETKDGTISVDDSIRIRAARKQLLLAAAHSVIEPLPHFARLSRSEAVEFLAQCREVPSKAGSFVSEVIVPVSAPVGELDVEAPFARQVTELLSHALGSVSLALESGDDEALLRGADRGLSANFLSALAELRPPGGHGALDIGFRWSASRQPSDRVPGHVRFGQGLFNPLSDAARVLRDTSDIPGYEVEGLVARLDREPDDPAKPGDIVIATVLEDRPGTSKVHVTLDPEPYRQALEAHRTASRVRVTGTLVRRGRKLVLDDPGGFVIEHSA